MVETYGPVAAIKGARTSIKRMALRNPANDENLLTQQYGRLRDALDGFYSGKDVQALNIAITLRVLVHETKNSKSLLSRLSPEYWNLPIFHIPLGPKQVFRVTVPMQIRGDGFSGLVRPTFDSPSYLKVPLSQWWNDEYQPLGASRQSKKTIVLNVADKDGGAHVDGEVADTHAALSQPPFFFGMDNGGQKLLMQPNLAYGITAQAGCEMQEYLERNFPFVARG